MSITASTPFNVGDKPRIEGKLTAVAGGQIDPSAVYAWYKAPGATVVTKQYGVDSEVGKIATGIYYLDVSVTTPGTWYYGFYSTGTGQAASVDGIFTVSKSARS